MTQDEFNQKNKSGKVETIQEDKPQKDVKLPDTQKIDTDMFLPILTSLLRIKKFRTTAPTNTPKTYLDAIEFFDNGSARRVYFYINKSWRYVTLT